MAVVVEGKKKDNPAVEVPHEFKGLTNTHCLVKSSELGRIVLRDIMGFPGCVYGNKKKFCLFCGVDSIFQS